MQKTRHHSALPFFTTVVATVLAGLTNLTLVSRAHAQSTAFTYQGELKFNGAPANGLHDLRFKLWNGLSAGLLVAPIACADNVQVTDGKFTTTIDFGSAFVTAGQRFIEVDVRQDTGLDCTNTTGFGTLSPRTLVTAAPFATYASKATTLTPANGTGISAVSVDNNGNVGIGTTTPGHSVSIAKPAPTLALQDTDSTTDQVGYVSFRDSGNIERAWIGYGSAGDPDLSIINARPSGDIILNTFGGGNIGIGTASPASKLEVRGDIRMGAQGQLFAASGDENLRMLRGIVQTTGAPFSGSGWTSSRASTGRYNVSYNTFFTDVPIVVAMAGSLNGVIVTVVNDNAAGCQLVTRDASGTLIDAAVRFVVMGAR